MNSAFLTAGRQGDVLLTPEQGQCFQEAEETLVTSPRPQVQTNVSCQFFTNLFFLCLKSIKASCLDHFFRHIFDTSTVQILI